LGDQDVARRGAGHDHRAGIAKGRRLQPDQVGGTGRIEPGFKTKRVMTQGDDAACEPCRQPGRKRAIGQPVDQQGRAPVLRQQQAAGFGKVRLGWRRK
jgi:hypothetical protein